jgi:hypothetical protein
VEIQQVTGDGDGEEEVETSETEIQVLFSKVDFLTDMMKHFFPLLGGMNLQETSDKRKSQKFKTPKNLPWDQRGRDPTFTQAAGFMAYSSKDSSPKDYKRRETI